MTDSYGNYALLVSFPDQSETFTLGVEAGVFWQRLSMGEREFEYLAHTKNLACLERMAASMDLQVKTIASDDEWTTLGIYPKAAEKERPRLMLINGGIHVSTEKMEGVSEALANHELQRTLVQVLDGKYRAGEVVTVRRNLEGIIPLFGNIFSADTTFIVNTNATFDELQAVIEPLLVPIGSKRSQVYLSYSLPVVDACYAKYVVIDRRRMPGSESDAFQRTEALIKGITKIAKVPPVFIVMD